MQYRADQLLSEAIHNLRELRPHFAEGSPDHDPLVWDVLGNLSFPELPADVSGMTIEFEPHEAAGPRAAVGNEYRKLCIVAGLVQAQHPFFAVTEFSHSVGDVFQALVGPNWTFFPKLRKGDGPPARDEELERQVVRLLEAFEAVFHYDWTYTDCQSVFRRPLDDDDTGELTFLEPGLSAAQECDDWQCRGRLLEVYRELAKLLKQRGYHPKLGYPPDEDWLRTHPQPTRVWRDEPENRCE